MWQNPAVNSQETISCMRIVHRWTWRIHWRWKFQRRREWQSVQIMLTRNAIGHYGRQADWPNIVSSAQLKKYRASKWKNAEDGVNASETNEWNAVLTIDTETKRRASVTPKNGDNRRHTNTCWQAGKCQTGKLRFIYTDSSTTFILTSTVERSSYRRSLGVSKEEVALPE